MALSARHVLAPVDLSEESLIALESAAQAVAVGGTLTAIYVLERLPDTTPAVLLGRVDDAERAKKVTERVRAALTSREIAAEIEVVHGAPSPALAIADYAAAHACDLVVIGSSGRTGLTRIALGSVAEHVVRYCHCPVLVVRR